MRARAPLSGVVTPLVRWQAVALICVATLAVVLFALEQFLTVEEQRDEAVVLELAELRGEIVAAQSAHRGYLLIGDRELLAPYRTAPDSLARRVAAIEAHAEGADRRDAGRVAAGFEEWRRAFAEPTLRLLRAGRRADADRLVRRGAGARRIDGLRRILAAAEVRGLVEVRGDEHRRRLCEGATITLLLLACVALWAGSMRMRRRVELRVVAPARALAETAGRLGDGDLSARAAVQGVREIAVVASAVNGMADEVERLVAGLRDLHEQRHRFVAFTSHELRSRVTSVAWSIEALLEGEAGPLSDAQRELLDVTRRNADRLGRLVDDLLLLQRLEAGRVQLQLRPVQLSALVREVGAELRLELDARDASLEVDCPAELTVSADPDRLHQAVANLVVNALKFGRGGDPVRIRVLVQDARPVIEVRDRGRGIPPDEVAAVGAAFTRASNAADVGGTGLGLAIVREVVELHGGTLEVDSELGVGTTLRLRLPRSALLGVPDAELRRPARTSA